MNNLEKALNKIKCAKLDGPTGPAGPTTVNVGNTYTINSNENAKVQNARILGVKMIKKLHKILLALSFAGCYICVAFDLREVYNQKDYARCEDDEKFLGNVW